MKSNVIVALLAIALVVPFASSFTFAQEAEMKVDVNRAAIAELVALPGVGEKVAERIVNYRKTNGPFRDTRELMNVRGIGEKTYLKLEPYLTLTKDAPKKK